MVGVGSAVLLIGWGSEWTGPCMNPALAIALKVVRGDIKEGWRDVAVYAGGPIVGAVVASVVFERIVKKRVAKWRRGRDGAKVGRRRSSAALKLKEM